MLSRYISILFLYITVTFNHMTATSLLLFHLIFLYLSNTILITNSIIIILFKWEEYLFNRIVKAAIYKLHWITMKTIVFQWRIHHVLLIVVLIKENITSRISSRNINTLIGLALIVLLKLPC